MSFLVGLVDRREHVQNLELFHGDLVALVVRAPVAEAEGAVRQMLHDRVRDLTVV